MHLKIKNYQFLISSSAIRMICTIIVTYIFTNFFSVKDFALYNIVLSLSIILSGLVTSPQYYFLANNQNKKNLLKSSRENINLILFIFLILIILIFFFKDIIFIESEKILFYVLICLTLSLTFQIIIQNISRIEKNYFKYFKISIVERVLLLLVLCFSFLYKINIELLLISFSLLCLIFFTIFFFQNSYLNFNFNFLNNKNILKESSYAFFNNIITISIGLQALIFISGNLDQFIITNSISIGLLFLSLASLPLGWIETVVGPVISRIIKTNNTKVLNHFINLNFKNVLYLCYVLSVIIIFFSSIPYVFEFFFQKYSNYKDIIFIFSFLVPVMGSKIYLSWFLVCLKKTKYMLYSNILVLISFILIFFYLKFNIKEFLFYYVLFLLVEMKMLYGLFSYFYKIKHVKEIYLLLAFTILNLIFYNFYYEAYYKYVYINLIYIVYYLKKNNLKNFLNVIDKS